MYSLKLPFAIFNILNVCVIGPPTVDGYISDHASVCCKLLPEKPPAEEKVITYWKYKSIDLESFKGDLEASLLRQDDRTVETSAEAINYNFTFSALIDCHAPMKTKRVRSRPSVP